MSPKHFSGQDLLVVDSLHSAKQIHLTTEEAEVLDAALQSRFDLFKVNEIGNGHLGIVDSDGTEFMVDTIDLDSKLMEEGQVFFTMIGSKASGRYFLPSRLLTMDEELFSRYAAHKKFKKSWPGYLTSFFKYQVREGLSERTADKHVDNVDLMLSSLENSLITSFTEVTKAMLKSGLKRFAKHNLGGRIDLDKVYYSLYKFFDYIEEGRGIQNPDVVRWLRAII